MASAVTGRLRSRPAGSSKHACQASAFTSQGCPCVSSHTRSRASPVHRCPVSAVCWASSARTSSGEKSPSRSEVTLTFERAAAGDHLVPAGRPDAVVAHVAQAAQDHALREVARALGVAGAQLPQHGYQGVPYQRVDLVDQQHQRLGAGRRPQRQHLLERIMRPGAFQQAAPRLVRERVVQVEPGLPRDGIEDRPHRRGHVLARGLRDLDVAVQAAVLPAAVQFVIQRQQRRRLAGLPGGVQHEVALPVDQLEQFVPVQPLQRRHVVVILRDDRPRGVEEAHPGQVCPFPGAHSTARASLASGGGLAPAPIIAALRRLPPG